jgi:thiol-disulfide isomerase/thioredoxin
MLHRLLFAICLAVGASPLIAADEGAPIDLELATLDGAAFRFADHRGKWVVVNYWATWCAPCIKEIPDLSAFDASRDDAVVVGLAFEEIEEADLRAFLQRHPASYPIVPVDVYAPPAAFEVPRGLPTTYLVDPEGHIAHRFVGPITGKDLATRITELEAADP